VTGIARARARARFGWRCERCREDHYRGGREEGTFPDSSGFFSLGFIFVSRNGRRVEIAAKRETIFFGLLAALPFKSKSRCIAIEPDYSSPTRLDRLTRGGGSGKFGIAQATKPSISLGNDDTSRLLLFSAKDNKRAQRRVGLG